MRVRTSSNDTSWSWYALINRVMLAQTGQLLGRDVALNVHGAAGAQLRHASINLGTGQRRTGQQERVTAVLTNQRSLEAPPAAPAHLPGRGLGQYDFPRGVAAGRVSRSLRAGRQRRRYCPLKAETRVRIPLGPPN